MTTAIVLYILLLFIFLVISSLIFRHAIKFSYLSPRFKYIVGIFAVITFAVIVFSIYLLLRTGGPSTDFYDSGSVPSSSGGLNF
jgi:amino acid transporter